MIVLDKNYKHVLAVVILTSVYILTGLLGLTLAVPPGYATVFWPPSGFALAAVYIFGYQMGLGVFWGAFLTNMINYWGITEPDIMPIFYMNAIFISLGSTIQACFGAYLIKKFIGPETRLENFVEIFKFSLLAGPLSCLFAASIGVSALAFSGSIPISNFPYTWANWYVGDILGVLVFSPILVILFAGKAVSLKRKLSTSLPIVVVFLLVLLSFFMVRESDETAKIKKFQSTTALIKKEIDNKLSEHFGMLKSVQALYAASDYVDFNEFSIFADKTIDKLQLVSGIGYTPLIQDREALNRFLNEAKSIDSFNLRDFDDKHDGTCDPFCTPLKYVYPLETHKAVAGLDLSKHKKRAEVIQKVIDTGKLSVSGKISLARSKENGFLSVMPVFSNDSKLSSANQIVGFIVGGSSYKIVFANVLNEWNRLGFHLNLYDDGELVYEDLMPGHLKLQMPHGENPFIFSYEEDVAGRNWRFEFLLDEERILADVNWNIWFALAASLFFTFFATIFLLAVTGQTAAVENIVVQKTKELSDNNRFLRMIMDSVPDLVFVKNRFSQIVQANKSFLELYPPEQRDKVIGRTGFENFPDSEVEIFKEQDKKVFEKGYSETFEPITNYKGETRNHFMRKIGFKTESGIQYLLAIGRDLTQEQETLDQLQKSEERFRTSIENAPIGMSLVGMDQEWILYNQAMADMLGYGFDEFGKKSLEELTHPDDIHKDSTQIRKLLAGQIQSYSVEKRYQKKDGSYIWVLLTLAVVRNDDNNPQYYVAHTVDITDRKQAEQLQLQVAKMVDSAVTEFYIVDSETLLFLDINKAALENLGYSRDVLLKKTPAFIKPDSTKKDIAKLVNPLISGEVSSLELDTTHQRKDGSIYDVLVNLQMIDYQDRKAIMAIVLDITERKTMENDLLRSNKELEEFAYVASHDLKAPLRHVSLSADFLSHQYKDKLDDKAGEFLDIMTKSTKRMQDMIDSLLDYSRVGQLSADDQEVVNMGDVVGEALENLKASIDEKNATVNVSDMPEEMTCNSTLMIQLFQNLIQNSMKYKKDDVDPVIHIEGEIDGRNAIISVSDNGIGIKKEYADKIFQVFRRLHHNEEKYEGTGIGLAICQRIVETHNGKIWLDTDYEDGCRFVIKLPIVV